MACFASKVNRRFSLFVGKSVDEITVEESPFSCIAVIDAAQICLINTSTAVLYVLKGKINVMCEESHQKYCM